MGFFKSRGAASGAAPRARPAPKKSSSSIPSHYSKKPKTSMLSKAKNSMNKMGGKIKSAYQSKKNSQYQSFTDKAVRPAATSAQQAAAGSKINKAVNNYRATKGDKSNLRGMKQAANATEYDSLLPKAPKQSLGSRMKGSAQNSLSKLKAKVRPTKVDNTGDYV